MPIALTDQQLTTVMQTAKNLSPDKRDTFLQRIAATLQRQRQFNDDDVARACTMALAGLVHEVIGADQ